MKMCGNNNYIVIFLMEIVMHPPQLLVKGSFHSAHYSIPIWRCGSGSKEKIRALVGPIGGDETMFELRYH